MLVCQSQGQPQPETCLSAVMSCCMSTGPQAIQTKRRATSGQVLEAKPPVLCLHAGWAQTPPPEPFEYDYILMTFKVEQIERPLFGSSSGPLCCLGPQNWVSVTPPLSNLC